MALLEPVEMLWGMGSYRLSGRGDVGRQRAKGNGLRVTVKADMFSWSGFAEGAGRCAAQGCLLVVSSSGKVHGVAADCNAKKPPRGKRTTC